MKYSDSYEWSETFSASNLVATQYSTPWFEVDFANELISDGEFVMASRDGSALLDVDVERYSPYSANTAILSHTQIAGNGTTQDEQEDSSIGAGTMVIGTRVRYVFTLGGTWSGNVTCSVALKLYAKRN